MTTLLERCQETSARIDQLEQARRNAGSRALVQQRAGEWKTTSGRLSRANERATWMSLAWSDDPVVATKWSQLRHNACEVLTRLKTGEDLSKLTEDSLWERLLKSADGAAQSLDDAATAAWRAFVGQQGVFATPEELRSQLAATPANEQALAAYRAAFDIVERFARQPMPRASDDRTVLVQAVERCREALAKVQRDVPPDVDAFFKAVYANSATLATLTPGVLEWLGQNSQLQRYAIRNATS